jgi:asparagine synthase (glutamine-hydrolysing)
MRHRGPDDEGLYLDGNLGLGVCRLSIIDVSGGQQPIFNEDGTVAIIFNGEIYNYRELTSELKSRGHRFATRSDTEAIVHAYEEWGKQCVDRLRGMFAFAIYDFPSSNLFLARDRLGIKPLYYYRNDGFFLFASEVRSLLASGLVPRRLRLDGLHSYLAFGSVQEPLTLIEGVYSLPPAHRMVWKMENGKWKGELEQYWDFFGVTEEQRSRGAGEQGSRGAEVMEELRVLLEESVRLRLIAEVPLGAFLSGGIDSGAVVALMSQVAGTRAKTFTIAFEESEFSEAPLARLTAERFRTDHTEVQVTGFQVLAELPQALAAMDQPTIDGINTYYVSGAAKQAGLTVALSGLGGDEIFAGYGTFHTIPHMMRLARYLPTHLPSSILHSPLSAFLRGDHWRKLGAFLAGQTYFAHPYFLARALFIPAQVAVLLTPEAGALLSQATPWHQRVAETLMRAQTCDPINTVSYLESAHYLVSTLLRDTDQMSMAHSLEVRVPLIDHELVEFMMHLPGNLKISYQPSAISHQPSAKPLLVNALNGSLPDEVVYRQKSPFTFPWERWLRHELRDEVERTLRHLPQALAGVLDGEAVMTIWRQFLARQTSWSRPWSLYVLFQWMEREIG